MSSDRAKRARTHLAELGRAAHVSKSGIQHLLAEFLAIPDDELPGSFSRRSIGRACAEAWSITTSYGALFQSTEVRLNDGELVDIHVLAPLPLLEHLIEECPPFACRMAACLDANSPTVDVPWRMCLYSDEAAPGNAMKHDNRRMTQTIYWSFVELCGMGDENLWFPLTVVRSSYVSLLEGGMSHLMRILLRYFFSTDGGHNLLLAGMMLRLPGERRSMLFARFALKIADESALHQVWLNKGASGLLFCLYCSNCVSVDSGLSGMGGFVSSTCLDMSKFVLHTNDSIRGYINKLADPRLGSTDRKALESELGFKHNEEGLLSDRALARYVDPVTVTMVDWMHTWIVNGVWNLILGLLMRMLDPRIKYADVAEFLSVWSWPKAHEISSTGTDVASPKRSKGCYKDGVFKCSASEALAVYNIIKLWVEKCVMPTCQGVQRTACECYIQSCAVLDLLKRTQRHHHTVTPKAMHTAVVRCLTLFLQAFGEESWIPKCHYSFHFGLLLQWHGYLASCFVHERKHKVITRYGSNMNRLEHYERVVLREVFLFQRLALRARGRFCTVQHTQPPSARAKRVLEAAFPGALNLEVTPVICINDFGRLFKGDAVWTRSSLVAHVWLHAVVDSEVHSFVSYCTKLSDTTWRVNSDDPVFVRVDELQEALIFSRTGDVVTIIPPLGL